MLFALLIFLFCVSCSKDESLVDIGFEERIFSFEFTKDNNAIEVDSKGSIRQNIIEVFLPPGTDKSSLVPTFEKKEDTRIEVGGIEVISGETSVNFTSGAEFTVIASDNTIVKYTVVIITDDLGNRWNDPAVDR